MRKFHGQHGPDQLIVVAAWLFSLCQLPGLCADGGAAAGSAARNTQKGDVRTLNFPKKCSIGALILLEQHFRNPDMWATTSIGVNQISGAKGTVTVTVPPRNFLLLDANRRIFENPAYLKEVSPNGIDILKLSFISLADSEDDLGDKALPYVNYLKGLKMLTIDRSETTDAGLSQLKDLPKLHSIAGFLSGITGSCFKDLAKLPGLVELSFPWCQIDMKNLEYLAQFPKLRILDLSKIHLNEIGTISISKCSNLNVLLLRGNQTFNDKCLQHLAVLKKLQILDVGDTAVTVSGLKTLSGLKLKLLTVPTRIVKEPKSSKELKALFPGCLIEHTGGESGSASAEDKQIYAPLK